MAKVEKSTNPFKVFSKVAASSERKVIYMDNHATTPVDPRVLEAMMPYFTTVFGNAASRNHAYGWSAEEAVEAARLSIAQMLGANPKEIVFTSGATESNNLAIRGVAEMYAEKGKHIITTAIEHKAILDTCKYLETKGFEVTYLPVDHYGQVRVEDIRAAVRADTILISIMAANNEIGTINRMAEIGTFAKERGILFHTDAVQAIGRIPVNVEDWKADLLSLTAHKIYGPKGIGALYIRRKNPRVRLSPILFGGGHERGVRSGTLNVPGIVGFGKAAELVRELLPEESARVLKLRERLHQGILAQVDEVTLNGHPTERLPNNLNVSFAYVEGEALMMSIPDVAVSSGSACTSASLEPSYVLKAIGVGEDLAHSSIRFGLGRFTTEEEVDHTIEMTVKAVQRLREMSPLYEMAKEGIDLKTVQWTTH